MRECTECGIEFDPFSPAKAAAGGRVDHCHRCARETSVRYLGLTSGDGKASGISILAFKSYRDRDKYSQAWNNNTGMNRGKVCQMSSNAAIMSGLSFEKVHEAGLGMNHKGKA